MSLRYDLHAHSIFSDGELTPEILVDSAKQAGVDVLALTDHDTIDGLERAQAQAMRLGMKLVPGVEISVRWTNKELHVLGLGIDKHHLALSSGLRAQQQARIHRAERIAEALAHVGIKDALQGARALTESGLVTRPHFAQHIVNCGRAVDMADAFKKYLAAGKPGFVATEWVAYEDAIGWIKQAGGVAVLAHPARYKLTMSRLHKLLTAFADAGGEGMEVITSNHTSDEVALMARLCREYHLVASVGSDFHGPNSRATLGVQGTLPEGLTPVWEKLAI